MHDGRMVHENVRIAFGKRIRKLRQQRGWDQVDLSAHSGFGRVFISNLENGKHEPRLGTIKAFADCFGMSMSALLKGLAKEVGRS
jgi:transcriptional regulator with XRE-family HTH domain